MTFSMLLAGVLLAGVLMFFFYCFSVLHPRKGTLDWVASAPGGERLTFCVKRHPMERSDALPVLILTVVYAFTAFFSLGRTSAPQGYVDFSQGESYTVVVSGDSLYITGLRTYSRLGTGSYNVELSADGEHWSTLWTRTEKDEWDRDKTIYYWADAMDYAPSYALPQSYDKLFKWVDIEAENLQEVKYFRITGKPHGGQKVLQLTKFAFLGQDGQPIPFRWEMADGSAAPAGFDELFAVDGDVLETPSWRNSSYFDEIYHPRTALEHIEGVNPYENTHPPLGKIILGLGIRLFGMTPFGWRFMGTLFGVLMVPIFYVLAKYLFGKRIIAICTTAFFTFDFMHLTQTRIATIDTYGVFFILVSSLFFYRWLTDPATPTKSGKRRQGYGDLALSGVFWGIGCACKWTVIYAGVGLAVLYLIHFILRCRDWDSERDGSRGGWIAKTLLVSVACYVVVPLIVYTLAYSPYAQAWGMTDYSLGNTLKGFGDNLPILWKNFVDWRNAPDPEAFRGAAFDKNSLSGIMLDNQWNMLHYHSGVHTPHPYSSRWYQWLVDGRPILYYSQDLGNGWAERFASFNNPVLSWAGLISLVAVGIRTVQRRCGKGVFLLVSFLAQFLPWVAIGRITFAYHYFPSTLFLALALGYVMNDLVEAPRANWKGPVVALTSSAVGLYFLFYPGLTGIAAPKWYFDNLLSFLPSWPL